MTQPRLLPAVAVALASAWMSTTVAAAERSTRTVVAIHWSGPEFPASPAVNTGLLESLVSTPELKIDYFVEYLESDRFPPRQASLALRDYIRAKYQGRRIDVVIPIADPALQFVADYHAELFPDASVVFSGVAVGTETVRRVGGRLTAVLRGAAYIQTLKLALALHPGTREVFVVAKSRDARTSASVRSELSEFSSRVRLTYIDEPSIPRLLAAVRAVPRGALILYVWHSQEDPGNQMYADEIARMVAEAAPVPVYGTNDRYIGTGVVGGAVRGTRETAVRMGEMARAILQGTRAQDIPIETARLIPILDWRQLQRWGIDESRLPAGSVVRFSVPSLWQAYRWRIMGTFVIVVAQLLLIAGLLTERATRRRAEQIVRAREATLRTSYEQIRQLAGRLINAQETARANIARDLHDDVCQDLVGVSIAISGLKRSSGDIQDPRAQQALFKLHRWALAIVEGVRRLSHELHPATLQLLGLAAALQGHCIEVEKRHDVQVAFTSNGNLRGLHPSAALCLFRIAQEALRNGAVHGDARRLRVAVARSGEYIELTVSDDGRGFDLESVRRNGSGLGLVSIEERAHVAGGDVHIVSAPGQGTTVFVRVPAGAPVEAAPEVPCVPADVVAMLSSRNSIGQS